MMIRELRQTRYTGGYYFVDTTGDCKGRKKVCTDHVEDCDSERPLQSKGHIAEKYEECKSEHD